MDHWRTQRGNQKMSRNIWQWKDNDLKPMEHSKSSSKREVYSNTILTQGKKKILNILLLHLKQLEKEEQTKP